MCVNNLDLTYIGIRNNIDLKEGKKKKERNRYEKLSFTSLVLNIVTVWYRKNVRGKELSKRTQYIFLYESFYFFKYFYLFVKVEKCVR